MPRPKLPKAKFKEAKTITNYTPPPAAVQILHHLYENPDGLTNKSLKEKTGLSDRGLSIPLKELRENESIEREGKTYHIRDPGLYVLMNHGAIRITRDDFEKEHWRAFSRLWNQLRRVQERMVKEHLPRFDFDRHGKPLLVEKGHWTIPERNPPPKPRFFFCAAFKTIEGEEAICVKGVSQKEMRKLGMQEKRWRGDGGWYDLGY